MDDVTAHSHLNSTRAANFFASKPTIYIVLLLATFLASYFYTLRATNIFACQANGYSSDRYLAYCQADNYGDYEHGAFWFDLEPNAERSAAKAA